MKPTQEEVIEQARREATAEALTRVAEDACVAAADAWDDAGIESKRDECYRARRLLPGARP